MLRLRVLPIAASVTAALLLALHLPAAAEDAAPDALAGDVIRSLGLQADLPRDPPPSSGRVTLSLPLPDAALPDAALWAVVVVAVAVLLVQARHLVWRRPAAATLAELAQAGAPDAADHLARAEHFARQGLFVPAMHELLLEAVRLIRARGAAAVAESQTSREILRRAPLPQTGLDALRDMIQRVERSYFGEHPADDADWHACRASFAALRDALDGAPA